MSYTTKTGKVIEILGMEQVDKALRRGILPGTKYEKYFKGSDCELTSFGRGDTFLTIRKMKEWAERYTGHTRDFALGELAGLPMENIVDRIHNFLYWHFQYRMDGEKQYLKSPNCAWKTRAQGIDCKSYSIIASTILNNLGIKHYFRKVRQPNPNWPSGGIDPTLWSHVYVIVPKDQKRLTVRRPSEYWVIDATVLSNREVPYLEKREELMSRVSLPQYGLAAPGLKGCSCVQKKKPIVKTYEVVSPRTKSGVQTRSVIGMAAAVPSGERELFMRAIERFQLFLADLVVNKGLPVSAANRATERFAKFVEAGIEPTIKDLFAIPLNSKEAKGLGVTITAPVLTSTSQLPRTSGYFNATSTTVGKAAGAVPVVGQALSLITSIVPKDIYNKTFGALFANGFKFKCWGASRNPAMAEKMLAERVPEMKNRAQQILLGSIENFERAVNDYMVYAHGVDIKGRWWLEQGGARDCTRDGLKVSVGGFNRVISEVIEAFKQHARTLGHDLQQIGTRTHTYAADPKIDQPVVNYQIPNFRLVLNRYPTQNNTPTNSNNDISDSYVDKNGKVNFGGSTGPSKAGFGLLAGGALAALAISALVTGENPIKLNSK
ncbi:hypothetical protein [Flagellimonas marina]|uniref:Transglutaminase-like domain-containing protein n=1 Tax=Flagellimonas marina TaxID=1775168 RepID=A0ABV8PKB2_9FLAO